MVSTPMKLNDGFIVGKPNTPLAKNDSSSAISDGITDSLAKGETDCHCKIKATLFTQELEPAFNVNEYVVLNFNCYFKCMLSTYETSENCASSIF